VSEDAYGRPRRAMSRRSGRRLPLIVGLVLLLAAIALVADRVAAKVATDELRSRLVAQMSERDVQFQSMDVRIGGFPFLTQVAQGVYNEIAIDMAGVELPAGAGRAATLPTLNVIGTGVNADTADLVNGTAKVTAEQVTGTAVVSLTTLETIVDYSQFRLSGVTFSESAGGLKLSGTLVLSGISVPVSATADITVTEGQLRMTLRDVTAINLPAPPIVRNYLGDVAQRSLVARLPPLPFGMTLEGVQVRSDGLAITATGHDVPLVA
jgi:hypothetical protein